MTISRTTPSQQIGLTPTEKVRKIEYQIKRFWEMFDTRIDKDNAVNGQGKNMLKMAALEQIVRFEEEIEVLQNSMSRVQLEHIECEPVWKGDKIELFDMFLKDGTWIGSKRLLKFCEELDARI